MSIGASSSRFVAFPNRTLPLPDWRQKLRLNFTKWEPLADFLELGSEERGQILQKSSFRLNLPLRLAEKIAKGRLDDPILRQFLPTLQEEVAVPGFTADPLQEREAQLSPRLLKKYAGRALLVTSSACAMHCRYCFRRHFDYAPFQATFEEELAAINADESLSEILLSGGDPLSLSDEILARLIDGLNKMEHVKRLRFHSRFPIGIPERIDFSFIELLKKSRKQIYFVIHCNHPLELDAEVAASLSKIRSLGIPVLNQAVLLKGVNDSVETLKALSMRLIDEGILPYYLYQLDPVAGSAHFEVEASRGKELVAALARELPGYGVPRYVQEIAGEPSKVAVRGEPMGPNCH